jgi:hypothetical protein
MPNITVTANGNAIDMEALRLKNEKSVAVGNMKVNARGDEISPTTGEVTRTRNQRMADYYRLHTTVPVKKPRAAKVTEQPPTVVAAPALTVQEPVQTVDTNNTEE